MSRRGNAEGREKGAGGKVEERRRNDRGNVEVRQRKGGGMVGKYKKD